MTRRDPSCRRLAALCCTLALCLAFGPGPAPAAGAETLRPNLLLIVADDAGYSDLGSFGGEIHTPNLDALAAAGVRFTNFNVSATCSPSRSMLLTGVDSHIAGLGNMAEFIAPNQIGLPGYEGHINDSVAPLPDLLRDAGYHTYMAGKWHMGDDPDRWPAARGFERDLTLIPGGGSHLDDMWGPNGERQLYTSNGAPLAALRPGFHSSVDYTAAIIASIEANRQDGQPFFAYLALQAPHDPFQLPADWRDRYRGRYDAGYDAIRAERIARMRAMGLLAPDAAAFPRLPEIPAWDALTVDQRRDAARRMELFAAMVEHMDASIGTLIGYLKTTGQFDDTVIVFLSDNGPEGTIMPMGPPWDSSDPGTWGGPGTFIQYGPAWAQVGAGPLRLFKGYLSEGGIRTPLIVAGRGVRDGGRISAAVAHVTDIPATLLALAGVEPPVTHRGGPVAPIEGMSLAPLLDGTAAAVRTPEDWTGWELFGNRAIRQDNWKLLWICAPRGPGQWQLYDLAADPAETIDLAAEMPERVAAMEGHWADYVARTGVVLPSWSPVCAAPE